MRRSRDDLGPHEEVLEEGPAPLYVREIGDGVPLVVLHGGPDFDHAYLVPDTDRLADVARLVYYDQRGRGRSYSGDRPGTVTISSEVDDLDRVRERVGTDRVALLGHSWGGLLAMEYAVRRPDAVSHLILMNTAPPSRAGALELERARSARRAPDVAERLNAVRSSDAYQRGDVPADTEYHRLLFDGALRTPELLDRVVDRLRVNCCATGILAAREIEQGLYADTWFRDDYDLTPELVELDVPTLVLHGDSDFVPVDLARELADVMPRARSVVLADCGHFASIEQPERVLEEVGAHLSTS